MPDRPGVRYPKFKDHFSVLDFSTERELFCISLYPMPKPIPKEKNELMICGLDCKIKKYTWQDFQNLPKLKTKKTPLVCQIFNCDVQVNWEGWKLKTVLESLKLAGKENKYYAFYSRDGMYFESLTHKEAMDDRSLIVCGMNNQDLPNDYGGPIRLAVPFMQGYKSVKWLAGIASFKQDPLGTKVLLEQSKTGKLAPIWKNKYGLGPLGGRVREQGSQSLSKISILG